MVPGFDHRYLLGEALGRQAEIREHVRCEAEARRPLRFEAGRSPAAFRIWRLHVMVWFEGASGLGKRSV
jgi:hypothetical protein